jgi:hypothetical protein
MTPSKGGLRTQFSFTNVPRARPIRAHTCSAITRRLCGWLGASGTHDLRAQSEQPAVARTAVELHRWMLRQLGVACGGAPQPTC